MEQQYSAGNGGKGVRSDCRITVSKPENSDGIHIRIRSKVDKLYGKQIEEYIRKLLAYFEIKHMNIEIEDYGALDFVLAARLEAALNRCTDIDREYLPDLIAENEYHTTRDRYRRSRLYLPGNQPKFMINAGLHKPDGIILDLEDSVAPAKKEEARYLVRNALRQVNFYGAERMVRINQIPAGLDDLEWVVPHNVNLVLVPKCETAEQIQQVDQKIADIATRFNLERPVFLMPIIESAKGVVNAYPIASASENVVALAIGLEDYTADLGTQRTAKGRETFFARCQVVNAARAAGVQPIDSVFSDVSDMEALRNVVLESKSLGFEGMGCIHPRQIQTIHTHFAPNETEIEKAKKIVHAFFLAEEKGLGVVSLGSKMIDPPVVKRAQKTIDMAIETGLLHQDWRDEYVD